uniref:Uncharacterized protein n=1 Tax=Leviviridae sp. TaxID=2027243 RepID=A0A514D300_9VIRU|nr:MAG: hypothetical protein H1Rhizo251498_000003 [Leviviridae sp.]
MAFSDPTTVTISGTPVVLPRVYSQGSETKYTSGDGLVSLSANHTLVKQGRERHLIRIDHSKITANPFDTSENMKVGMAVYTVFDLPPAGYTDAEALAVFVGFNTLQTATSNALITKLLGGES